MTCYQLVSLTQYSVVVPCGHTHDHLNPRSKITTTAGSNRFVLLLFGDQLVEPGGRHDAAWRPRLRVAEETAMLALMVET